MSHAHLRGDGLAKLPFVPRARFSTQKLTVNRGDDLTEVYEDVTLPVVHLAFDYPWGTVRAGELQDRFFIPSGGAMLSVERDLRAESEVRMWMERFGAVEIDMVDVGTELDSEAEYLLGLEEDAGHFCCLTRQIRGHFEAHGAQVEVDADYPYVLVEETSRWYVELEPEDDKPNWFSLELGVEVDGSRVNLLPVLLELLERAQGLGSLEALHLSTTRLSVVPVGDKYMELSPSLLESLWRVLIELYGREQADGEKLAFDARHASALTELGPALEGHATGLRWYGDRSPRHFAEAITAPPAPIENDALRVRATLRPYQLEGVAWLEHMAKHGLSGVLADDMGLGKTLQTITHLDQQSRLSPLADPRLVLCPTSLVGNWSRELARFAPQLRVVVYHGPNRAQARSELASADVIISTYPVLCRDPDVFDEMSYSLLVLDEAQAIKTPTSQIHQAVKALRSERRLCLSGTPIENNLGELWAMFDFLEPGLLGDQSDFRQRFPEQAIRLGDEIRLEALCEMVAPYILRRTKESVARDLPPKTQVVVPVTLSGKQRELYESIRCSAHEDVRRTIRTQGFERSTIQILDALMKLRQLCCDPRLVRLDAARFVRESAKYQLLMERLRIHLGSGRRVLIFSQFTRMLSIIGDGLRAEGIDYITLTGGTKDRQGMCDAFEAGLADVFLISLKAGGTGLNLTSADTVIHYDPWWNPAAQDQATDRAYRIGQKRPVVVEQLVVEGSVEERMLALQQQKRTLSASILGDAPPSEPAWSERAVEDLFAPLD